MSFSLKMAHHRFFPEKFGNEHTGRSIGIANRTPSISIGE